MFHSTHPNTLMGQSVRKGVGLEVERVEARRPAGQQHHDDALERAASAAFGLGAQDLRQGHSPVPEAPTRLTPCRDIAQYRSRTGVKGQEELRGYGTRTFTRRTGSPGPSRATRASCLSFPGAAIAP